MSMEPKKKETSAMNPAFGFVIFVVLGLLSFFISPIVVKFLTTTSFGIASAGAILPITFPADWPSIVPRLVVTVVLFVILFTLSMIPMFAFVPKTGSEMDVDIAKLRKEKQQQKNRRR